MVEVEVGGFGQRTPYLFVAMYSTTLIASAFWAYLHLNRPCILAVQATEASLARGPKEEKSGTATWDVSAGETSSGASAEEHNEHPAVESQTSISQGGEDAESAPYFLLQTSPSSRNVTQRQPPTRKKRPTGWYGSDASADPTSSRSTSTTKSANEHRGTRNDDAGSLPLSGEEQAASATKAAVALSTFDQEEVMKSRNEVGGERGPPLSKIGLSEQRRRASETTISASTAAVEVSTGSGRGSVGATVDADRAADADVVTNTEGEWGEKDDQEKKASGSSLRKSSHIRGSCATSVTGTNGAVYDAAVFKSPTITASTHVSTNYVRDGRPSAAEPRQQRQLEQQRQRQRQHGFVVLEGREQEQQRQQRRRQQRRRQRTRRLQGKQRQVAVLRDDLVLAKGHPEMAVRQNGVDDGGLVSFQLDRTAEAFMTADDARDYLNGLVDKSATAVNNQVGHKRMCSSSITCGENVDA